VKRTGKLGALRLEFIPLVPAVAMHDDAEDSGGRLGGLARDDAVDMERRRLAAVKDRLGSLVRRWHDLHTHRKHMRGGANTKSEVREKEN